MADPAFPPDALLPPPLSGWPVIARVGSADWPTDQIERALTRIRAEALWWPLPQTCAVEASVVTEQTGPLAVIAPHAITRIEAEADTPLNRFGTLGDVIKGDAQALLRQSLWTDPWRSGVLSLEEGVEALSFLAAAARQNSGGFRLIGMSPWKQRCLAPFLTGPDGPPNANGLRHVIWGAGDQTTPPEGALRVEDGFLRSVGLGLRHTPPASLTFDHKAPYFDATRRNGFEDVVDAATFTPQLLSRAAALRARILALRLSKYNVGAGAAPSPAPAGRSVTLVPGQVETDASIRLGGVDVRTNRELLLRARQEAPDAFLIYKPHPDVLTGLREGAVDDVAEIADHVELTAAAPDCLDWADHVFTITSLMGFEALLRGKRVTTLGRPFYAGWGLTHDLAPPQRSRMLTLDELTASALILYPRYIDPITRLPAPPEVVVEALATEMAEQGDVKARMRRVWRNAASWVLNRI